jgi:hypothetical protein
MKSDPCQPAGSGDQECASLEGSRLRDPDPKDSETTHAATNANENCGQHLIGLFMQLATCCGFAPFGARLELLDL